MSVKRHTDPAGLMPDRFTFEGDGLDDLALVYEALKGGTPRARIDALREYPQLRATADRLAAMLKGDDADHRLLSEIAQAETSALYLRAAPGAIRDNSRQAGTRKERGSRMPELDAWLDNRLPESNGALWQMLPTNREDFERSGIYRDGKNVIEYRDDTEHAITRAGFNKRVTAARKRRQ